MKIVYSAGDITEAEIVKGMLVSNGIDAHVSGYYLQGGIGEMAPTDLAKVHVNDEDYESAKEIIRGYDNNTPAQTKGEIANEDEESTPTPKFLLTLIMIVLIATLSYWIGI